MNPAIEAREAKHPVPGDLETNSVENLHREVISNAHELIGTLMHAL